MNETLYEAYCRKCEEKGLEPLPFDAWKGPRRYSPMDHEIRMRKGEDLTKQEAAKVLGYKNAAPVSNAIRNGHLKADGKGGVTEESVMAYRKELDRRAMAKVVTAAGMTDAKFDALADDAIITMTKRTLLAVVERKVAEAVAAAKADALAQLPMFGVDDILEAI